jgi:leucyl-tRNA synthetase
VWRLVDALAETVGGEGIPQPADLDLNEDERALRRKTHDTIRRVSQDLDPRVHLNTAVSALMELVNELYAFCNKAGCLHIGREAEAAAAVGVVERPATISVLKEGIEALVLMLSPFAPHMAEELWERLGHADGLAAASWAAYDARVARPEEIVVPVQVNGKVRSRLTVPAGATEDELLERALADPAVAAHIGAREVRNVVVARGRLVNVVVG